MVRVGLFGVFEGEDALTGAVVRTELARRIPAVELRVYTPSGRTLAPGFAEIVAFEDQPLGACTRARQEELAATLDAVVISGTIPLDAVGDAPERLLVEGLGAFEPDVPVAWFAVSPDGVPAGAAAAAVGRRTAAWVVGHGAVDRLEPLGADPERLEVVPHPASALPRVAPAADMPAVVERLRAASALPPNDYVALGDGAPEGVPDGVRLSPVGHAPMWTPLERAAAIAMSAAYVGDSRAECAIAAAYGRPALWTGRGEDVPRFAVARGGRDPVAAAARVRTYVPDPTVVEGALEELDAAFDALASFLTRADDDRIDRALRVRLREESRAAAEREAELRAWAESLEGQLVDEGPRFAALWRRLHEGDRHYNWHKTRADRAEAEMQILWREHERSLAMRAKRSIRSTKMGDAAARALGAGPLQPPPARPAEESDTPTA